VTYTDKPLGHSPLARDIKPERKPNPLDNLVVPLWSTVFPSDRLVGQVGRGEVRSVSSTGGEKGVKPQRYSLLPVEALAAIAEHYGKGAAKYSDHNWRRGYEWSKSYDALQRHLNAFWSGEDLDAETGSHHLAAAGFHVLALLQWHLEGGFTALDDRYRRA
jgi:hypothetical protein